MMSDKIEIELFPAGNGDAILLDFGQELILVDAGYTSTFKDHIKPRLRALQQQGRRLTKFVVTHIDADHISGAIAFIKENGQAADPTIIAIDEIWFNSYRHLKFKDKEAGNFSGVLPQLNITGGNASEDAENENTLVSHKQGTTLGSQILKYKYNWNTSFGGLAVKADDPLVINHGNGLKLTLLGPTQQSLDKLADTWYGYLKRRFDGQLNEDAYFDDAFELMAEEMRQADLEAAAVLDEEALVSVGQDWVEQYFKAWELEDRSVTNGSSITFLLDYGGKKLLFLGDAIPGQVVAQLKRLVDEDELPLQLDVLKVSHHGAWPNNSPELIAMLKANYYLFSSNGRRHHHPHLETLAMLLKNHGPDTSKTLVFNYKQGDRLLNLIDSPTQEKYNYQLLWPDVDIWGNGLDGYVKLEIE